MATSGIKISNLTCSDVISANDLVPLVHEGTTYHTSASSFLTSQIVNLQTVTNRGNTTSNSLSVANLTASDTIFNTTCVNSLQTEIINLSSGTGYAEIKTKNIELLYWISSLFKVFKFCLYQANSRFVLFLFNDIVYFVITDTA